MIPSLLLTQNPMPLLPAKSPLRTVTSEDSAIWKSLPLLPLPEKSTPSNVSFDTSRRVTLEKVTWAPLAALIVVFERFSPFSESE